MPSFAECSLLSVGGILLLSGCRSVEVISPEYPAVVSSSALQSVKNFHPKKLTASIEGFAGASYRIEMNGDHSLLYLFNPQTFTAWPGTKCEIVPVTEERWRGFRQSLDHAQVWNWRREYVNRNIQDGTVWTLKAEYADASIDSHGDNAFPAREQFDAFRAAVGKLLGGKDFK